MSKCRRRFAALCKNIAGHSELQQQPPLAGQPKLDKRSAHIAATAADVDRCEWGIDGNVPASFDVGKWGIDVTSMAMSVRAAMDLDDLAAKCRLYMCAV